MKEEEVSCLRCGHDFPPYDAEDQPLCPECRYPHPGPLRTTKISYPEEGRSLVILVLAAPAIFIAALAVLAGKC